MKVPDAEYLAAVVSRLELLERAHQLEVEELERLREATCRLERICEEQEGILRALRVSARGAS